MLEKLDDWGGFAGPVRRGRAGLRVLNRLFVKFIVLFYIRIQSLRRPDSSGFSRLRRGPCPTIALLPMGNSVVSARGPVRTRPDGPMSVGRSKIPADGLAVAGQPRRGRSQGDRTGEGGR
jgi:hypothetical protein